MVDKVFVMVNPWGLLFLDEILADFDQVGKRVETAHISKIPIELIVSQYLHHQYRSFFQSLTHDLAGKPAVIAAYEGNPLEFTDRKNRLRRRLNPLVLSSENPLHDRNVVHTSESYEEYVRDVGIWKDYFLEKPSS